MSTIKHKKGQCKPHIIIKVFKRHPFDNGYTYRFKVRGRKPTISQFAPMGKSARLSDIEFEMLFR